MKIFEYPKMHNIYMKNYKYISKSKILFETQKHEQETYKTMKY